jgi:hypothetical protein
MRVCKLDELGLIYGKGGPGNFGSLAFTFVPAAPASIPVAPIASGSFSLSLEANTNNEATQQVLGGAMQPTVTSSMPNTINTTVSVTSDSSSTSNGWISTTVTIPSSTTGVTNTTVASSVPSTLNPTSNAQPSTPDVQNRGPGPETGYALEAASIGLSSLGGSLGKSIGSVLGAVNDNLGLKDMSLFSPETPHLSGHLAILVIRK